MKTSLGFYEIVYDQGIKQIKELIGREDYEIYKKFSNQKSDLINLMKGSKKKERDPKLIQELKKINLELKDFSFPFFVVDSPIYDSITTGILHIGRDYAPDTKISIKKIENIVVNNILTEE